MITNRWWIPPTLDKKFTLEGDQFRITMSWYAVHAPVVLASITYAGSGQADLAKINTDNSTYTGPKNTPSPVALPGKPDEIKIDWFNDGSYIITVKDTVAEDAKWYPPVKSHDFDIDFNGVSNTGWHRPFPPMRVKAESAIPATMKEKVSGIGVPQSDKPIFNPVAALMTARTRKLALNGEGPGNKVFRPLIATLDKDIDYLLKNSGKLAAAEELKWSTRANAFDTASREFITIIDQMDRYDRKESYPEDIANEAVKIVEFTKGQFRAAILMAYSDDTAKVADVRQRAQLAFCSPAV